MVVYEREFPFSITNKYPKHLSQKQHCTIIHSAIWRFWNTKFERLSDEKVCVQSNESVSYKLLMNLQNPCYGLVINETHTLHAPVRGTFYLQNVPWTTSEDTSFHAIQNHKEDLRDS